MLLYNSIFSSLWSYRLDVFCWKCNDLHENDFTRNRNIIIFLVKHGTFYQEQRLTLRVRSRKTFISFYNFSKPTGEGRRGSLKKGEEE